MAKSLSELMDVHERKHGKRERLSKLPTMESLRINEQKRKRRVKKNGMQTIKKCV